MQKKRKKMYYFLPTRNRFVIVKFAVYIFLDENVLIVQKYAYKIIFTFFHISLQVTGKKIIYPYLILFGDPYRINTIVLIIYLEPFSHQSLTTLRLMWLMVYVVSYKLFDEQITGLFF